MSDNAGRDEASGEDRPDDAASDERRDDEPWPEQTSDDTDSGWGEYPDDPDDDERILREKPPHW